MKRCANCKNAETSHKLIIIIGGGIYYYCKKIKEAITPESKKKILRPVVYEVDKNFMCKLYEKGSPAPYSL